MSNLSELPSNLTPEQIESIRIVPIDQLGTLDPGQRILMVSVDARQIRYSAATVTRDDSGAAAIRGGFKVILPEEIPNPENVFMAAIPEDLGRICDLCTDLSEECTATMKRVNGLSTFLVSVLTRKMMNTARDGILPIL